MVQPEKDSGRLHLPPKAKPLASPLASGFDTLVARTTNKLDVAESNVPAGGPDRGHENPPGGGEPAGGQTRRQSREIHGNAVVLNTSFPLIDQTDPGPPEPRPRWARSSTRRPLRRLTGIPPRGCGRLSGKTRRDPAFGLSVRSSSSGPTISQQAQARAEKGAPPAGGPPGCLTIVLFIAALVVWVRRLRTLGQIGLGVAVVMVLAWAATRAATNLIAGHPKQPGTCCAAVSVVVSIRYAVSSLTVGILAIPARLRPSSRSFSARRRLLVAYGADWPAGGQRYRGTLRWVGVEITTHVGGARILGLALGLLILVLIGFNWPGIITALVIQAIWQGVISLVLRRQDAGQIPPPAPA